MFELHINIDHVATLREARKTIEPSPLEVVKLLEHTQASGITIHLREDRRHINDSDVKEIDEYLSSSRKLALTFEMGASEEIRSKCLTTKARLATLVPERREELTTEGGLDVIAQKKYLSEFIKPIKTNNTQISFFIDPIQDQIYASKEAGGDFIEIHTGTYANLFIKYHKDQAALGFTFEKPPKILFDDLVDPVKSEITRISEAISYAQSLGLKTNLGHGLSIPNLPPLLEKCSHISELHIGHSIISNSIYYGLKETVAWFLKTSNFL